MNKNEKQEKGGDKNNSIIAVFSLSAISIISLVYLKGRLSFSLSK